MAKRADGVVTHFVYDLAGNLIAEHAGDGAWQRIYFRLDGMLLGDARRGGGLAPPRAPDRGSGAVLPGPSFDWLRMRPALGGGWHAPAVCTPQKVTDETAAVVWGTVYLL